MKIEALKHNYSAVQAENTRLQAVIDANSQEDTKVLDHLRSTLMEKESEITKLKNEIADKDTEIEAIIAKVETLLG